MSLGFHKLAGAWLDYKLVNVRRLGSEVLKVRFLRNHGGRGFSV